MLFYVWHGYGVFFCFKQKTAYEMRISDWSSDVCSSDLADAGIRGVARTPAAGGLRVLHRPRAAPRAGARRAGAVRGRASVLRGRGVRDGGGEGRGGDAGRVRALHRARLGGRWRHRPRRGTGSRSEENTSELQALMGNQYAVF